MTPEQVLKFYERLWVQLQSVLVGVLNRIVNRAVDYLHLGTVLA